MKRTAHTNHKDRRDQRDPRDPRDREDREGREDQRKGHKDRADFEEAEPLLRRELEGLGALLPAISDKVPANLAQNLPGEVHVFE